MLKWEQFLLKNISADGTISAIDQRQLVIRNFCTYGLYPFLRKKGYAWRFDANELTGKILRLLHFAYRGQKVYVEDANASFDPEHKLLYWHALDTDYWETFWDTWGSIEDFAEDGFAYQLRFSLPHYVWNWIDLDRSPRAIKLERDLHDPDGDMHAEGRHKEKDDPYLQDLLLGTTIYDKHRL